MGIRVVVVGSGLAGLTCALQLTASGVETIVVSPGQPGRDGASNRVHALAPWILLTAPVTRGDSSARYLADLDRRSERRRRPGLAEVLAEQSQVGARALCDLLGLELMDDEPVILPGDDIARGLRCRCGTRRPMLSPLVEQCREAGVQLLPRTLAIGVLGDDSAVAGIVTVALGGEVGGALRLAADAVVLACGGVGAVFPSATCPRWCRGSGLALATLAGALFHRPEMTQAIPVTTTPPLYFPSTDAVMGSRILIAGRRVKPFSDLVHATSVIASALRAGSRVELVVDDDTREAVLPPRLLESPQLRRSGRFPLGLALHHSTGGVAIDTWGRTSVPGLYACGEAAGGVQGTRRTMGTGLLEAFIFGRRAGEAVAGDLRRRRPQALTALPRVVPFPSRPERFEARLDELLAPLVHERPHDEVVAVEREITHWSEEQGEAPMAACAEAGLRWSAARALLKGQLGVIEENE